MNQINLCSFVGYRPFSSYWWRELGRYVVVGWWRDIATFYRRGRYGWAPRDTWSLDYYLAQVLAGTLTHLSEHGHGSPGTYPYHQAMVLTADGPRLFDPLTDNYTDVICDHELWRADQARWAKAFQDILKSSHQDDVNKWLDEEKRAYDAVSKALQEMSPWFGSLWD